MGEVNGTKLYDYVSAGRRVGRDPRTIKRWRREGMPTQLVDGQRFVLEADLLQAFRRSLKSSPTHYYRMRTAAIADGRPAPEPPKALRRRERQTTPEHALDDPEAVQEAPAPAPVVIPPLSRGADEYAALTAALRHHEPACAGIDAFTADRLDDEYRVMLAGICASCPVLDQCREFAAAGRPAAGYWATRPGKPRR